jgi:SAM-dependent methyltransferase
MDSIDSPRPRSSGRRLIGILFAVSVVFAVAIAGFYWRANYLAELTKQTAVAPDRIGLNAPFITSSDPVVDKMIELAELTADDVAYDLGCGDGRIIIAAALKTGCRGVGFDIDPQRVAEARENAKQHGVEHLVEIREQDVFTVDMREADVALFYLLPWMAKKLIPQFQQMKPGSRLISHDFGLGDIKAIPPEKSVAVDVPERLDDHYVHRWTVPLTIPPAKSSQP